MSVNNEYNGLEIAIIGMSAQFPGSADYWEFWQNLKNGKELLRTFTDEELKKRGVPEATLQDQRYVKTVGSLDNKDNFDASFFGYTPDEASIMDPQIRLFHQICWHALEDAGYASSLTKHKIGLFAGASNNENWRLYAYGRSADVSVEPFLLKLVMAHNFISSLISYKLNLRGPAMYIDTACSTSLAAVNLACRSLLTRECSLALAGGASITSEKQKGYFYREGMISSVDGHCRAFDSEASGTAWGEGAGVVALKRLSEAIKDRDHIYAVIKASFSNNDGNQKVGYTAPGVQGQADCIISARKLAGIDAKSVTYIEAHGTGTKLGDPIEIKALNEAFGMVEGNKKCAIGSVKTNIGHLDAAAGVAGLIKAALSLKFRQIPASLHFKEPNQEIEFANGPFYVNTELKEWRPAENLPLRAGVSSFGIGGTNVHVILEEAPELEEQDSLHPYKILAISAKTEQSLICYQESLKKYLLQGPAVNLADMCYTLQVGRKHFSHRRCIVFRDSKELIDLLDTAGHKGEQKMNGRERQDGIAFMFPGQGSQYINMGKDLYLGEPVFRAQMDKGFSLISDLTGEDFKTILFPPGEDFRIDETLYTQPLLFLIEYSLARLIMSMGVIPAYMIGHSIGEYVAAAIGGVFSFEDALRLVIKRGQLMDGLARGVMLSVPITVEQARVYLSEKIFLSAINAPGHVVLSGDSEAVKELIGQLDATETPHVRLHTSHAFHSGMQDAILAEFKDEAEQVVYNATSIPFISNLTGTLIGDTEVISADYWVRHLRETVQFSGGIATLLSQNPDMVFIEVGAGHSLTGLLKQQPGRSGLPSFNLLRSSKETGNDIRYLADRIGQLWTCGVTIDWNAYYGTEKRRRISLPAYSFERTLYPAEVDPFESGWLTDLALPGNTELKDWIYYPSWKMSVTYTPDAITAAKRFLFFLTDDPFFISVTIKLKEIGHKPVEVSAGREFIKNSPYSYCIDPEQPGHFVQLAAELKRGGILISDIIYGWGMTCGEPEKTVKEKDDGFNLVYFSITNIIRALQQSDTLNKTKIVMLTDSLHRITGFEKGSVGQSLMLGLVNVIPQEYPVSCINIDINLAEPSPGTAIRLVAEVTGNAGQDRIVALRNGQRWVRTYQKNDRSLHNGTKVIQKGMICLITGGLGKLGFVLARHLVQHYEAKLILTGRRMISDKADGDDPGTGRLNYLKSLSKDVRYFSADVSDLDAIRKVVEEVERSEGPIQGIIHTAGLTDTSYFELTEDTSAEKAMPLFAPKIRGIHNIYDVFKDRNPDFVWISSSLSAILGGLGLGAYSSANLYMDHFVSSRAHQLVNWKCLDLPGLSLSGEERSKDGASLSASEIVELFNWSISFKDSAVIIVNKGDLMTGIRKIYENKKEPLRENDLITGMISKFERPELSTVYREPVTETERRLVAMYENFLGIEKIGIEDDFLELGVDSLKGMVLLKKIKKEFNINLNLFDLLVNVNIKKVGEKIEEMIWFKSDVEMDNEITI